MQNTPQNCKSHQKQGKPTDAQQAHEKMLNMSNYLRNLNQTCHEISLKSLQTINGVESVEKREPFYTVGGNVSWCCH